MMMMNAAEDDNNHNYRRKLLTVSRTGKTKHISKSQTWYYSCHDQRISSEKKQTLINSNNHLLDLWQQTRI